MNTLNETKLHNEQLNGGLNEVDNRNRTLTNTD